MRVLVGLTVVMGVLIVAGVGVVAATIFHRAGLAAPRVLVGGVLEEPAGTRMVGVSGYGDRLAIVLQGGGPDRVVVFDPASGRSLARVVLAH